MRLLFASIHCYRDPSSGAALCTRELLELLAGRGMDCRVLTTGILDPEQWVEHVQQQGRTGDLQAARDGSVSGSSAAAGLEEGLWLCPVEDRRRLDSPREGMLEGFSLGNYLLLVDYTGRLFREGKAVISAELGAILKRLGSSAANWQARLRKLAGERLLGRFFAATRSRLREVAQRLGVHRLANLAGCAAR